MSSSSDSSDGLGADAETRTRPSVAARRDDLADPLSASDITPDRLPSQIGKYRVTGYLGRGGMGVVLSAHDTELDRPVALKLLHSTLGDKARSRMEREAQAMAKLAHPNVITVYEFATAGDQWFIAMELVPGVTLREWIRRKTPSWRERLALMIAAGRGLAAAHAAGLVHRDFKPDNILVGPDARPRVTDFGLVASSTLEMETTGAHEGPSVMGGTPAYMPPEQWGAGEIDARADQYAFAVTCWEALWEKRPFATRPARGETGAALASEPERLRSRRGVPRRIELALRRALNDDREKRWPTLSMLLDRLQRLGRDRRPIYGVAAVVSVAVGAVVASRVSSGSYESPCRTAGSPVSAVWTSAKLKDLREAFERRPEPTAATIWEATERALQGWVDEYQAVRIETCELARSGGSGVKDISSARDGCLDRRLGYFAALLTALEKPDGATMAYARSAALGLARPAGCRSASPSDSAATTGPAPDREKLAGAHEALARAHALRALGKPREAVAVAKPVAESAEAMGWQPLIALAYLELGLAFHSNQDSKNAEPALGRAILSADASRDDDDRFQATIALSENAMQRSSYDEAARLIESARMIGRRLPDDPVRDIAIANQSARLMFWRGEFADCVKRSRELVDAVDRTMGQVSLAAEARLNLSRCLQAQGRTAEYEQPLREALAIMEKTVGRNHPFAADAIMGLGAIAREEDRPADALPLLEEALAIRERVYGPDNPDVAALHNNIGNVLRDLGRIDEARDRIERALAIWEKAWGPDSPAVGVASSNLGKLAMRRGDLDAAEAYFKRALAIRRKTRPVGHPELAGTLVRLGELLIVKRDRECLPLLREAVEGYRTNEAQAEKKDEGRFMLGRALFELGDDRVGGRKEMEAACAPYDAKNDPFDCRAYLSKLAKPAR